jgi:uncharacterized protein (DUF58 family)
MKEGIAVDLAELIALKQVAASLKFVDVARSPFNGNQISPLRGRGMDFSEVRNYQAGDEIRHMEWRVTARTGRPHIKLYQEERERPVIILVDLNPSMFFGTRIAFKSVIATKLAALLTWTVIKQGDRIGGLFFSSNSHHEFPPTRREAQVLPMLGALCKLGNQRPDFESRPKRLQDALISLRRVVKPGTVVALISDFYTMDAACETHLRRLTNYNQIIAYHICDPLEMAPPKPNQYAITNGEENFLLDTRNAHVYEAYNTYCQSRIETLKESFKRTNTQYLQVTAQDSLKQIISSTFPTRRKHG